MEDKKQSIGDGHMQCVNGILSTSLPDINRAKSLGLLGDQQIFQLGSNRYSANQILSGSVQISQMRAEEQIYLRHLQAQAAQYHQDRMDALNRAGQQLAAQSNASSLAQQHCSYNSGQEIPCRWINGRYVDEQTYKRESEGRVSPFELISMTIEELPEAEPTSGMRILINDAGTAYEWVPPKSHLFMTEIVGSSDTKTTENPPIVDIMAITRSMCK